jgi:predicted phage tail component-like protein
LALTKTITWNGAPSTNVEGLVIGQVTRDLLGVARGSFLSVGGKEGFYHFEQARGAKKIVASMFIEVESWPTARRAAVTDFANWLDVTGEAKLIISDEPDIYYQAVLTDIPSPSEWRDFVAPFEVGWTCQPYAYDLDVGQEAWVDDISHTHTWTPALLLPVYPVVEITPLNGTLTAFSLTTNGSLMTYTGSVSSGNTLSINSIAPIVVTGSSTDLELTGAYNPVLRSMAGVNGAFPILIPGSNSMVFLRTGGTATGFSISVTYRKKYRA